MEKIEANMILEILGRPPEHIKEALNTVVVKMGSEKGVKILNKKYHDPILIKDSKDLYTAFAEVSLELDSLSTAFMVLFTYMPSNFEIVSPENLNLNNVDLNQLVNSISQRLHSYDALTKSILYEKDMLAKKLNDLSSGVLTGRMFSQESKPQMPVQSASVSFPENKPKQKKKKAKK